MASKFLIIFYHSDALAVLGQENRQFCTVRNPPENRASHEWLSQLTSFLPVNAFGAETALTLRRFDCRGNSGYALVMSRYEFLPAGWQQPKSFAVGWDPALETYFAQVMDYAIGRDDGCVILWIGALLPHYRDIDELMRAVNDRIRGTLPEITLTDSRRDRLVKDMKIDYDGEAPHSSVPKSRAIPPIYVLRTPTYCPECREPMHVYTLGCTAFHDAEDSRPVEDFHFLRQITRVPSSVLRVLKRKCPAYHLDRTTSEDTPYLMNHCRCGARLDDDYVSGDVGAAFWPDTPEGYEEFKLFLLPIDEPIPGRIKLHAGRRRVSQSRPGRGVVSVRRPMLSSCWKRFQ